MSDNIEVHKSQGIITSNVVFYFHFIEKIVLYKGTYLYIHIL